MNDKEPPKKGDKDPNRLMNIDEYHSSLPEGDPKKKAAEMFMDAVSKEYGLGEDAMAIIHDSERLTAVLSVDPAVALELFEYKARSFFPLGGTYPIKGVCAKNCLRLLSNLERYKDQETPFPDGIESAEVDARVLRKFIHSFTGNVPPFKNGDDIYNDKILDALIENSAFCKALLGHSFQAGRSNDSEKLSAKSEHFLDGFLQETLLHFPDGGEIIAAAQATRLGLPFSYDNEKNIVSIEWQGRDALFKDIESALAQAESLNGKPPEELAKRAVKAKSLLQPWLDRKLRTLVINGSDDEWQASMLLALGANAQQYKSYGSIPNNDGWALPGGVKSDHLLQMAIARNLPKLTCILFDHWGDKKIDVLFEHEHYGRNLLHLAIYRASPEIIDYLLTQAGDRKAELLKEDMRWQSHTSTPELVGGMFREKHALEPRHIQLIEILRKHGAELAPRDQQKLDSIAQEQKRRTWRDALKKNLPGSFQDPAEGWLLTKDELIPAIEKTVTDLCSQNPDVDYSSLAEEFKKKHKRDNNTGRL